MNPLRVFLDTEALRHDPLRRSAAFSALTHLAERGVVSLHLSQLSVNEFLSGVRDRALTTLGKLAEGLKILKSLSRDPELSQRAHALFQDLYKYSAETTAECISEFQYWLDSTEVTVYPIGPKHAQKVFDAYFSGSTPFAQKKSRADLPDAFIWQALHDMTETGEVLFVSADNKFRAAAASLSNVMTFDSLQALLKLPKLDAALREGVLDSQLVQLQLLLEPWVRRNERVGTFVSTQLVGRKVHFFYPVDGQYEIIEVQSLDRIMPEGNPTYFGEGVVVIPFSGRAACSLLGPRPTPESDQELPAEARTALSRIVVFVGSLRVKLPPNVLGEPLPHERLFDALDSAEIALESLALHWEIGGKGLPQGTIERHAFDEVLRQLADGDLATEVDPDEEADRTARAHWRKPPEQFHGKHGDFVIGPDTSFLIAPMPRFEHWVRFLKKIHLETEVSSGPAD